MDSGIKIFSFDIMGEDADEDSPWIYEIRTDDTTHLELGIQGGKDHVSISRIKSAQKIINHLDRYKNEGLIFLKSWMPDIEKDKYEPSGRYIMVFYLKYNTGFAQQYRPFSVEFWHK